MGSWQICQLTVDKYLVYPLFWSQMQFILSHGEGKMAHTSIYLSNGPPLNSIRWKDTLMVRWYSSLQLYASSKLVSIMFWKVWGITENQNQKKLWRLIKKFKVLISLSTASLRLMKVKQLPKSLFNFTKILCVSLLNLQNKVVIGLSYTSLNLVKPSMLGGVGFPRRQNLLKFM